MKIKIALITILLATFSAFFWHKTESKTLYYYSTHGNAEYKYPCKPDLSQKYLEKSKDAPAHLLVKNNC